MVHVSMAVNGRPASADVDPRTLLVQFLRENLRLTGTHVGCDTSQCGACVVHVDGRAIKSCTVLAASCEGAQVTTIEGLATGGKLHPMQQAFQDNHGLQCGFCTPGMIMAAVDLVNREGSNIDEDDDPPRPRRQHLPLHRLPQHREIDRSGRARDGRRRDAASGRITRTLQRRPKGERHHGRDRTRRLRQTHRGHPLHHRQGPLRRRHQSSRPGLRLFPALPARARDDRQDRHVGGAQGAGRGCDLHRRRHRGRQGRRPHLRLDDPFEGRLADEGGRPSRARPGQGALCRRPCRRRHRGHLCAGARRRRKRSWSNTACCRRSPTRRARAKPGQRANPRRRAEQHGLQLASRRQGGDRRRLRRREARDQARPRQQPPDPEPDGAARRRRRLRFRDRHDHALYDEPEPACRAARPLGVHRPCAGTQASRHRARRRRRLRLEDLHLRRGDGLRLGGEEDRPAGQMDRRIGPRPSSRTRTAATMSRMPNSRSTRAARSPACASIRSPISAPISRPSRPPCRPIFTRRCSRANTRSPTSIARSTRSTPTPRRSTPIAAPGARRRPSSIERIVEIAARETGQDPAEFRRKNFIKSFPHQTPVIMAYDAGDYAGALDKALALADYKGVAGAQSRFGGQGQASRHRHFRLYRSLRHRAVGGGRFARRAASASGNRRKCASIRSARSRF